MTSPYAFRPIGTIRSCYREKFGVPRQPGLVKVPGSIEIHREYAREEAFRSLEDFSHIWVLFVFHQSMREQWKPTVRPPRLGGNERVGVFASRSMFRPNPIGMSVVELAGVVRDGPDLRIDIVGGDFVDGTPVLDIKPYLPYVDAIADARGGYAPEPPAAALEIEFTPEALAVIERYAAALPQLQETIRAILQYDPRPAYKTGSPDEAHCFAMRLYHFDLKWQVEGGRVTVVGLDQGQSRD